MSKLRNRAAAAGAAVALALGVLIPVLATTASAQSILFTATTAITGDGAVSYNVTTTGPPAVFAAANSPWADDTFTRTLTVYTADSATCAAAGIGWVTGDNCYTAVAEDTNGTFRTVPDALEPDQTLTPTGNRLPSGAISGTFAGTASYVFWSDSGDPASASNVPASLNLAGAADSVTSDWWIQSLPGAASSEGSLGSWSWQYATGCEAWADSSADNRGQSTPVTADGNITSDSTGCATPAPTPSPSTSTTAPAPVVLYGDYVNPFGNGFDVRGQAAAVNTQIIGWPATQHDPATHFLVEPEGADFRLEYAPAGGGDGLCVSNPGGGLLVLRGCNANIWQKFSRSGKNIVSAVGGIVNPDGRGAQLSTGATAVSWGGANYTWTAFASLPA